MLDVEKKIYSEIEKIISSFKAEKVLIEIETPRSSGYGDLATNIALKLSKSLKEEPQEIAHKIIKKISPHFEKEFEKIEVVRPGFINFHFSWDFLREYLLKVIKENESFARNSLGKGKKVLIEFVSANPTGPLSIAHGRQAAIGLSLANILELSGYRVEKEYYINDEGTQIDFLGLSLKVRCMELLGEKVEFPSQGYQGEYLIELAKRLIREKKLNLKKLKEKDVSFFSGYAIKEIIRIIKEELADFGIKYHRWISQKDLVREGKVVQTLDYLSSKKLIYKKEGALWFRALNFGDDQDRVVVREDGRYTYFAADIAYHKEKFERNYDLIINIWGPDHHGYISRVKAAVEALGYNKEQLKILIVQLATVYKNGKPIALSTRKGQILTLREVIDEIGKDATLYFLLTRKVDSHLDFDLGLAKKQSLENPVYYIQYAYARICSILNFAQEKKYLFKDPPSLQILKDLNTEEEKLILRTIVQFPRIVKISALTYEPSLVTVYLQDLASKFHSFYNKYRVVGDNVSLTYARLYLCRALEITLRKGLSLLGISAPAKM